MSVTIIVEITNNLLRHVSTHEVSSSGSSLVFAKITYECIEMSSATSPCERLEFDHVVTSLHVMCSLHSIYNIVIR